MDLQGVCSKPLFDGDSKNFSRMDFALLSIRLQSTVRGMMT